jgi:hypothetical protein
MQRRVANLLSSLVTSLIISESSKHYSLQTLQLLVQIPRLDMIREYIFHLPFRLPLLIIPLGCSPPNTQMQPTFQPAPQDSRSEEELSE